MEGKNTSRPPKAPGQILRLLLKADILEEVLGDLQQEFYENLSTGTAQRAKIWYWFQAINYLRPFALRKLKLTLIPIDMFRHNLLLGWRSVLSGKLFSIINIGGLALGMSIVLLVGLWINDELQFDKFHENYEEIYQVIAHRNFNGNIFTDRNMVFPLASHINQEIPQVKNAVWTANTNTNLISRGETSVQKIGMEVGGSYFDVFGWTFTAGSRSAALTHPASIILTKSLRDILFSESENPLGKVININNSRDLKITAIVEDPPSRSSIAFDFITPIDLTSDRSKSFLSDWNNYSWNVFVQSERDGKILDGEITKIMRSNTGDENSNYFTFPMRKWHLHNEFNQGINTGGTIRYVRLFFAIALITLLIACVNFMNLSTARAQRRAQEVAVRKTMGSNRRTLVSQFYIETLLVATFAFILACCAIYLLLPGLNSMVNKELSFSLLQPATWFIGLTIIGLSTLMAGSYPAVYLSAFDPMTILKGLAQGRASSLPRKILVIFQFVASIALVSATIFVFQQVNHVKSRDLGYDPNNLIIVPSTGSIVENYSPIKQALLQSGLVSSTTRMRYPITQIWWRSPAPDWPGRGEDENILFSGLTADTDFSQTLDLDILDGRDFDGRPADSLSVLLNKAAIDAMQLEEPIGKAIKYGNRNYTIVGITDNLIMASPFADVEPMMTYFNDESNVDFLHLRLAANVAPQQALADLENVFNKFNPDYPFDYQFADQNFQSKFASENLIGKILNWLSAIAIFLCCLGLVGMAIFNAERRRKELAVRKILGASLREMILLMSREYIILVSIAFLVAVPLSYLMVNNWLSNYEYHTQIGAPVFLVVGFVVIMFTYLVVGLTSLKTLNQNPIHSLRHE